MTGVEKKANRPITVRKSIPNEGKVIVDFEAQETGREKIKSMLKLAGDMLKEGNKYNLVIKITEEEKHE